MQDVAPIPIESIIPSITSDAIWLSLEDKASNVLARLGISYDTTGNVTKPKLSIEFPLTKKVSKQLYIKASNIKTILLWLIMLILILMSYVYYEYRKEY